MAKTGHPLALRLLRDQRDAFENLWENICNGFAPARFTKEWYAESYSHNPAEALRRLAEAPHAPYDIVERINPYDPLTVLAALDIPGLFEPSVFETSGGGRFNVIGLDAHTPGIVCQFAIRRELEELALSGLFKQPDHGFCR